MKINNIKNGERLKKSNNIYGMSSNLKTGQW